MARMARVMFEGVPFHVTHRGNHKLPTFEHDGDRRTYLALLDEYARRFRMSIWGYCLMRNHVHLVVVGAERWSISRAVGNTHREYSRRRNRRSGVTGHAWANRFFSTALDDTHLWAAIRYVELNPVRAGIVDDATRYRWSSAWAHADGRHDSLLARGRPFPGPIGDWRAWLATGLEDAVLSRIRRNTASGHPTGNGAFVAAIERRTGRRFRPRRRDAAGRG